MIGAELYRASRTARLVRGSLFYRTACTSPRTLSWLESSLWLNQAKQFPRVLQFISPAAAIIMLIAGIQGHAGIALGAAMFAGALHFPGPALLSLPTLLVWAPRLTLGEAGGEALFLRLDQFVVAGLIVRGLFHPGERLLSPPAHTTFVIFLTTVSFSIVLGLLRGTLAAPLSALIYLVQWLEFYALYVVAWTFAPRVRRHIVHAWTLPLIALAAYGLAEQVWPYHEVPGIRYRTFERVLFPGQANHAAGLFAFATATGLGIALRPRYRVLGIALALLASLALWPTGSRSGALAWAAGIAAFVLVLVPATRWWLPPLGVLGIAVVPGTFWARYSAPGSSMYDRLVAWKSALSTVDAYPLLGLGAGARHRSFYDNHYIMTLAESGMLGMAFQLTLLFSVARALGHAGGGSSRWMGAGALAGLAALCVHGLATATFIVTMTAGPCFWYCAVALAQNEEAP